MNHYDRLADLPLEIEGYELSRRERATSSGFDRTTTVVSLSGAGEVGRGEDVTYETDEHDALAAYENERGPAFDLAGEYTHESFSTHLDGIDLFPTGAPDREVFRNYRRWGFESAALDLALKQAGTDLASALGVEYEPVEFVASARLGEPPTTDRVEGLRERVPDLGFKLDATTDWTEELIAELASTGAVEIVDLKGRYEGTTVDQAPDPALYERVLSGFPEAIIEDPAIVEGTEDLLAGEEGRISWDAPIHGVADLEDLPVEPAWCNIKPSRFGSMHSLFETIEYCGEHAIGMYGGGQFELDVGREQLHAIASLCYPDGPNDVAPGVYNDPDPEGELPRSPLSVPRDPRGFEWPSSSVSR